MTPEELIEKVLSRTGRECVGCGRNSLTTKGVVGTGTWAMGQIWCPSCDWSANVFVDGDGIDVLNGNDEAVDQ